MNLESAFESKLEKWLFFPTLLNEDPSFPDAVVGPKRLVPQKAKTQMAWDFEGLGAPKEL